MKLYIPIFNGDEKPDKETYWPGTNSETTKKGYDLLVRLGGLDGKLRTPAEQRYHAAIRGAKRLKRALVGPMRKFLRFDSATRLDDDISTRFIRKGIASDSNVARQIMETIEKSWSSQRGNSSIDFSRGYIKVARITNGDDKGYEFLQVDYNYPGFD